MKKESFRQKYALDTKKRGNKAGNLGLFRVRKGSMRRSGQSLVECAICLPFLLLLLGAAAEFGSFLHTRQQLWGVLRAGALDLGRVSGPRNAEAFNRVKKRMLALGAPIQLRPQDILIEKAVAPKGFYQLSLQIPRTSIIPKDWLGSWVRVRLLVPGETL